MITKGDTGRTILDTLRASMRPLTTAQVCEAVMKARNLDTNDKALCRSDDEAHQGEPEALAGQAGHDPVYSGRRATFMGNCAKNTPANPGTRI